MIKPTRKFEVGDLISVQLTTQIATGVVLWVVSEKEAGPEEGTGDFFAPEFIYFVKVLEHTNFPLYQYKGISLLRFAQRSMIGESAKILARW